VDEVVDAGDESSEHVTAEERAVALLWADSELVIELVRERSLSPAVFRHEMRLAALVPGRPESFATA